MSLILLIVRQLQIENKEKFLFGTHFCVANYFNIILSFVILIIMTIFQI